MRDTPFYYSSWSLASFLQKVKADHAAMGTFGQLHERLVQAGFCPANADVSV